MCMFTWSACRSIHALLCNNMQQVCLFTQVYIFIYTMLGQLSELRTLQNWEKSTPKIDLYVSEML